MDGAQPPATAASLEAWADEEFRRGMELHFQRTSDVQTEREQVFRPLDNPGD